MAFHQEFKTNPSPVPTKREKLLKEYDVFTEESREFLLQYNFRYAEPLVKGMAKLKKENLFNQENLLFLRQKNEFLLDVLTRTKYPQHLIYAMVKCPKLINKKDLEFLIKYAAYADILAKLIVSSQYFELRLSATFITQSKKTTLSQYCDVLESVMVELDKAHLDTSENEKLFLDKCVDNATVQFFAQVDIVNLVSSMRILNAVKPVLLTQKNFETLLNYQQFNHDILAMLKQTEINCDNNQPIFDALIEQCITKQSAPSVDQSQLLSTLTPLEQKTPDVKQVDDTHYVPERVEKKWLSSSGMLLTDSLISALSQHPLKGHYHRAKIDLELLGPDRVSSLFPVTVGTDNHLLATYRDPEKDKSVILGEGSSATVKLAQDQSTTKWLAEKIFKPKKGEECEIFREALNEQKTVENLGLARSALITNISRKTGLPKFRFFMNLGEGETLSCIILERRLPKDPQKLLEIASSVIKEVIWLHEDKKHLHRDIKSKNICLDVATGKVTLVDFGFTVNMEENRRFIELDLVGTYSTLAPELIKMHETDQECAYSEATEVYSVGVVLFALLFGCVRRGTKASNVEWAKLYHIYESSTQKNLLEIHDKETDKLQYTLSAEIWDTLGKMCSTNPVKRLSLKEALGVITKHLAILQNASVSQPPQSMQQLTR